MLFHSCFVSQLSLLTPVLLLTLKVSAILSQTLCTVAPAWLAATMAKTPQTCGGVFLGVYPNSMQELSSCDNFFYHTGVWSKVVGVRYGTLSMALPWNSIMYHTKWGYRTKFPDRVCWLPWSVQPPWVWYHNAMIISCIATSHMNIIPWYMNFPWSIS